KGVFQAVKAREGVLLGLPDSTAGILEAAHPTDGNAGTLDRCHQRPAHRALLRGHCCITHTRSVAQPLVIHATRICHTCTMGCRARCRAGPCTTVLAAPPQPATLSACQSSH